MDDTIVVRIWIEPHDPRPRVRLVHVSTSAEVTVVGIEETVAAFRRMLRSSIGGGDGPHL